MGAGFERQPGGMAANVARAAAGLGTPWAVESQLIAPIGLDENSAWLETTLKANGVDTHWLDRESNAQATLCLILVEPSGERAIVSEPSRLDYSLVEARLSATEPSHRPKLIHVDGFHAPGVKAFLAQAIAARWQASLDLDELAEDYLVAERFVEFVADFDVVFINRARAHTLLGSAKETHWIETLARWSTSIETVFLLTLGAAGCVVIRPNEEPVQLSATPVHSVDSTGAGDVYAGVFLSCWLNGLSTLEAARKASIAGALATTARGAAGYLPDAAAIEALSATGNTHTD